MVHARIAVVVATVVASIIDSGFAARAAEAPRDTAATGCPVREGRVAVPGGEVWYRVVGEGGATPLLTLHGGPGVPHDYLEPLAALCHERPVVFYDQLGCGRSDRPTDASLWRVERFVEELAAVRTALGLEHVHILGQSWGTMLLADYLLTRPPGVESAIFSNPALSIPRWVADANRLRRALPASTQALLRRHEEHGWTDCPEYQAALHAYYARHVCRLAPWPEPLERSFAGMGRDVYLAMNGPSEFFVTGTIKDYDRTARLHEITVPSLFLCGRYDEATPETTALYHRLVAGSEMVVLEHSSHMAVLEERDRYLRVVRDFLRRVERKTRAR